MKNAKEFLDESHGWVEDIDGEEPDKIKYSDVPEYMF